VVARLTELAARYGERFQPDRGWASIESGAKPWAHLRGAQRPVLPSGRHSAAAAAQRCGLVSV